ncbi:MAG: tol-pal system YbgF family protein [Rubripirellula sp.]
MMLSTASIAKGATPAQLDALIASQDTAQAMEVARELDGEPRDSIDLTLSLARLARELEKANKLESAAEFFQRSVVASDRPAAARLPADTRVLIRVAAAAVFVRASKLPAAIAAIKPVLESDSQTGEKHRQRAVAICLQVGAASLSGGAPTTASEAYSLALKNADPKQRATAMLGDAWATAIQNDRPLDAAKKLATFIDAYPDHTDTPRAARACAECLKQADRQADSDAMLADLLNRWPNSETAMEVIRSHQDLAIDLVPTAVRQWIIQKANADDMKAFGAKTTMLGMLIATRLNEVNAWSNLAKHLAKIDKSGQAISEVLNSLSESKQDAEAERLATQFIAGSEGFDVSERAREAACRWAGRTQRWSMLALASESEDAAQGNAKRTVTVERLFAEALMQTGQVEAARKWWNSLVDRRRVDDFATLLRCAEAETSVGEDAEVAEQRIKAARKAAGDDRFNLALLNLLEAELSIRRMDFDAARSLLESVVRSSETEAGLRGRAQWLIGETHYLQQDFSAAIESYRLVEGIDGGGMWVSAALLQAGKSFEQLGRTREATVCYGNLVSRFADSSHAKVARQRLAAITPNSDKTPSNDSPSRQTIRR